MMNYFLKNNYSIYSNYSDRYRIEQSYLSNSSIFTTNSALYFFLTSALVQLFFLPYEFVTYGSWWSNLNPFIYVALAYIILLSTILYYFLYQFAIKKASPIVTSMIFYLQPAVAYVWSYFLLAERLTPEFVIGTGLTLFGVWLTTSNKSSTN